jgi:hypothetical protein
VMISGRMLRLVIVGIISVATLSQVQTVLATEKTFTGSVDAAGTKWVAHRVELSGSGSITASLDWTTPSANLNLYLYNPSGALVATAVTSSRPETIVYDAEASGTWKLGISAKSGATAYTLVVDYPAVQSNMSPQFVRTVGGPGHAEIYPSGVDVDPSGLVYVADTGDDQISSYFPAGAGRWTTGTSSGKSFNNPRDVAYLNGKIYVADTGNARVQVLDALTGAPVAAAQQWTQAFGTIMGISAGVDATGSPIILVSESLPVSRVRLFAPTGAPHTVASVGTGPGIGTGELNEERDAATDSAGNIYVADYKNQRIAVFGPFGGWKFSWGTRGTAPGQFRLPYGVDLDETGRIYVADANNQRIQRFTLSGESVTNVKIYGGPGAGAGQFEMMRRVAVGAGSAPDVYGADLWKFKVERFGQDGTYELTYGGDAPPDGMFNEPYGVSVDALHTFVIDTTNQRAQRFNSNSPFGFQLKWGVRGWGEGNPGFNWPRDLTIFPGDRVWVADTKNSRLTEFDRAGNPTGRKLGAAGSSIGLLNYPYALDAAGTDLIVADSKNNRIQRWDPATGNVLWSTGGFNFPRDLTVAGGVVYVADTRNHRIVKLDAADGSQIGASIGIGSLHAPEGIAVEPNGDVWVSDTSWDRLVEFSSAGAFRQKFGGSGTGPNNFDLPAHLEILDVGSALHLFVADVEHDRIQVYQVA